MNTSRGAVVDEAALLRALEAGRFFGVGLDVFEEEPLPPDSPLRGIDRVVLTPHEAASSPESLAELRKQVCDHDYRMGYDGLGRSCRQSRG